MSDEENLFDPFDYNNLEEKEVQGQEIYFDVRYF